MSVVRGSYYLLGPINPNIPFFFVYSGKSNDNQNIAYFLTVQPGQNGDDDEFIFDPRITSAELMENNSNMGSSNNTCPGNQPSNCCLSSEAQDNITDLLEAECESNCAGLQGLPLRLCQNAIGDCKDEIEDVIRDINIVYGAQPGCQSNTTSNSVKVGDLLILTANNVSGGWTYSYNLPGQSTKYLAVNPTNGNLISSSNPCTFVATQSQYADWNDAAFLAGVGYSFTVNGQQVLAQTYIADKVNTTTRNGIEVPTSITIETTNDGEQTIGTTRTVTETVRAVPNEIQVVDPFNNKCDRSDIGLSAELEAEWVFARIGLNSFTTLSDCNDGFRYRYCAKKTTCGTNNCKGPCDDSSSTDTCQFNSSNQTYTCQQPNQSEPIWRQPWFIILIVLFGIILVILVIALIVKFEHKKEPVSTTPSLN